MHGITHPATLDENAQRLVTIGTSDEAITSSLQLLAAEVLGLPLEALEPLGFVPEFEAAQDCTHLSVIFQESPLAMSLGSKHSRAGSTSNLLASPFPVSVAHRGFHMTGV